MLTWHPAGVVHVTRMREGPISLPGGGQRTSGRWDCFRANAGMFLPIRSDVYTDVYVVKKKNRHCCI